MGLTVTVKRCPRCTGSTISGVSGLGFDATLDTTVLDPIGELEAVLDGRQTYTVHELSEQIVERSPRAIRTRPAGTRPRQSVHPEHRCEDGRR